MQKSFITTVDGWRFERPLAITLGLAAAFMVTAVPPDRLSAFPSLAVYPAFQPVIGLILGLMLGIAGYAAMAYPWPRLAVAKPTPEETAIADDEQSQFAAAEVSLRLRRADRHPDAPVRAPIFASRDLGSPFMEVGAFAPPPAEEEPTEDAIPDGDYAEVDAEPVEAEPEHHAAAAEVEVEHAAVEPEHAAFEPETAHAPVEAASVASAEPEWPIAEVPAQIAAFAPEDEPAPTPARSQRQSISAMMDRLSAGIERRAATGDAAAAPQDRAPALREALDELNRLAARRG